MNKLTAALALATALFSGTAFAQSAPKPTVVLIHGAFADASSWNGVTEILQKDGYRVIAAANPLRSVANDAGYVSSLVAGIDGPVVLVGHSYGGQVISNAANGHDNVKSLVYVAAFAPETGETPAQLVGKFPGGKLGEALAPPVKLADGGSDLYIAQDKFREAFAQDVPAAQTALMAAAQRPITDAALNGASGAPAWKSLPSWFIYGDADRAIPSQSLGFMAERAGSKHTVVIKNASHALTVSHPAEIAALIEEAAK